MNLLEKYTIYVLKGEEFWLNEISVFSYAIATSNLININAEILWSHSALGFIVIFGVHKQSICRD